MSFTNSHNHHQLRLPTTIGNRQENIIPEKIPVISIAAPNMPAVDAYWGSTLCGAYIMPRELKKRERELIFLKSLNKKPFSGNYSTGCAISRINFSPQITR